MSGELSGRQKKNLEFYINEDDELQYNSACVECDKDCKQSFRVKILHCNRNKPKSKI